jgi:protein-S-isoprenylcysteine O-methyltransferase Ste14
MKIINWINSIHLFYAVISFILFLCIFSLIATVAADYAAVKLNKRKIKFKKFCAVEALSMGIFFILISIFIKSGIGFFLIQNELLKKTVIIIGTLIILAGSIINIIARINLGLNWSNDIKIYEGHKMITTGIFSLARHPLFLSLLLMTTGAGFVYRNYLIIILTYFLFLPALVYRAKKEEAILIKEFPEYSDYRKNVSMFFPVKFKKRD